MKKNIFLLITAWISLVPGVMIAGNIFNTSLIEVIFASKAYWDGPTKSCLPREKGCCFHISFKIPLLENQIHGDLTYNDAAGLTLKFSKTNGVFPGTLTQLIRDEKFYLDGEGTLSEEILNNLKLPLGYKIKPGYYPVKEDREFITVFFK